MNSVTSQLRCDVESLALPEGRLVGSRGHDFSRAYLARRMKELELRPLVGASFDLPYSHSGKQFCNLAGVAPGLSRGGERPVVIGAHYDSAIAAPCADDNLAAVAIALAVAGEVRSHAASRDVVIAFFDAEEFPYFKTPAMGSIRLFEDHMQARGVHGAILMDLVGHDVALPLPGASLLGLGNLVFMSGTESHPALTEIVRATSIPKGLLPVATLNRNIGRVDRDLVTDKGIHYDLSDQYVFRTNGVPYFFFSCGHWAHYHQPSDTPDKLNYSKMASIGAYLTSLLRAMAEADMPEMPEVGAEFDTVGLELDMLQRAFGVSWPLMRAALGLGELRTRDDLDALAARVQGRMGV